MKLQWSSLQRQDRLQWLAPKFWKGTFLWSSSCHFWWEMMQHLNYKMQIKWRQQSERNLCPPYNSRVSNNRLTPRFVLECLKFCLRIMRFRINSRTRLARWNSGKLLSTRLQVFAKLSDCSFAWSIRNVSCQSLEKLRVWQSHQFFAETHTQSWRHLNL